MGACAMVGDIAVGGKLLLSEAIVKWPVKN